MLPSARLCFGLVSTILVTAAGVARAANELCGQTITESLTLTADQACTGDGLVVVGDGITIDLGGFTLSGDGDPGNDGVDVTGAGSGSVVIKNGTIRNFDIGIATHGMAPKLGLDLYLIGAGNSAGQAALYFASHARRVTLVVRGDSLAKSMSHYLTEQVSAKANIEVSLRSEVQAAHGDTHLTAIDVLDGATGEVRRRDCGGLFVFIGADAETAWLPDAIARDDRGYVVTGDDVVKAGRWTLGRDPYLLESSVPGIFACGDVRLSPVKRVAAAVGEGSMAIAFVHQFLQAEDRFTRR